MNYGKSIPTSKAIGKEQYSDSCATVPLGLMITLSVKHRTTQCFLRNDLKTHFEAATALLPVSLRERYLPCLLPGR